MTEQIYRQIERLVQGVQTSDGAGVRLTRVLTQQLQRRLDPFLMLDAFRNDNPDDYIGGFPNHPHRGFETVTYMIAGKMRHNDSAGNEGLLGPGGVQWMTAGSGLIHSELPEQADGLMEGFQLWLNLPSRNKMTKPSYRDIPTEQIPEFLDQSGIRVRVIAGNCQGVVGAVQRPDTQPIYLDVHLPANVQWTLDIPSEHNAFTYTYRGNVNVSGVDVPDRNMGLLANDGARAILVETKVESKMLVIAGLPLDEPIAQYGPFVMNTADEIQQTLRDYRDGKFESIVVQAL